MAIGTMPMPEDFKFKDLYLAGRPKHEKFDEFWCKHPPMDCGKRAKIFKPFTALRGFEEEIENSKAAVRNRLENEIEYIPVYDDY